MQTLFNIADLEERRGTIRLTVGELATTAQQHRSLYDRHLSGRTEMRTSAFRAFAEALASEERRLLEHLIALHPDLARTLLSGGSQETPGGPLGATPAAAGDHPLSPPPARPCAPASPSRGEAKTSEEAA